MQENIPNINTMPPPIGTEQSAIDDISPIFVEIDNSRNLTGSQKAKIKLKARKYNPVTRKHETFIEKKLPPHSK